MAVAVRLAVAVADAVGGSGAVAITLALAVGDGVGVGAGSSLSQAISSTVAIREPETRASSCVSPASKILAVAPRMLSKTDGEIPSGRASRSIAGWTMELAGVMAACHCASVVVLGGAL